ncbi:MAG: GNAT family N-acetyltransferase [Anaerolineales bacterium]
MAKVQLKVQLKEGSSLPEEAVVSLYASVGWTAYTANPASLMRAIRNSVYVATLWEGETLIGLARCLSDDVAICYVQDILVRPAYQGQGYGRQLMAACRRRFEHVRMMVLITDDEARQHQFYRAQGFSLLSEMQAPLHALVKFKSS